MRNSIKKMAATIMATLSLATCMVGVSANAAGVTATKNFAVGSLSATAMLYRDASKASASTALNYQNCTVSLTYSGKTDSLTQKTKAALSWSGTNTKAYSYHAATDGANSGNISMEY
ncbi:MAG: hypothetical protein IJ265_03550 [Oscillospiraceae bacterium]|nr:hypothetical protein [Oscillospiraceae bacterium]